MPSICSFPSRLVRFPAAELILHFARFSPTFGTSALYLSLAHGNIWRHKLLSQKLYKHMMLTSA